MNQITMGSVFRGIINGAILGGVAALLQPPRRTTFTDYQWWIRWNLWYRWELEQGIA